MHDCSRLFNDCTQLTTSTDVDCFTGVDLGGLRGGNRPGCNAVQRRRSTEGRYIPMLNYNIWRASGSCSVANACVSYILSFYFILLYRYDFL